MKNLSEKQIIRAIRDPNSPATPSQLKLLAQLKAVVEPGLTKAQASVQISRLLGRINDN